MALQNVWNQLPRSPSVVSGGSDSQRFQSPMAPPSLLMPAQKSGSSPAREIV